MLEVEVQVYVSALLEAADAVCLCVYKNVNYHLALVVATICPDGLRKTEPFRFSDLEILIP